MCEQEVCTCYVLGEESIRALVKVADRYKEHNRIALSISATCNDVNSNGLRSGVAELKIFTIFHDGYSTMQTTHRLKFTCGFDTLENTYNKAG